MRSKQEKDRRSSKMLAYGVFVLVAIAVPMATYLGVSRQGHAPPLPHPSFSAEQMREAMTRLTERARGFSPTEEEKGWMEDLQALHMEETGPQTDPSDVARLEGMMGQLEKSLTAQANADKSRFLLMGDVLAVRFHEALVSLLRAHRNNGDKRNLTALQAQVTRFGGSFYRTALSRGVITPQGNLRVPEITPQVLFRYRWGKMAALNPEETFSVIEKKALYDFIVTFNASAPLSRRLEAADNLSRLDTSYDAIVAKAHVLLDAGDKTKAIALLKAKMNQRAHDPVIQRFITALDP